MAKKKKARKKVHRAKSSSGRQPERLSTAASTGTAVSAASTAPAAVALSSRPRPAAPNVKLPASRPSSVAQLSATARWGYVQSDLRRVGSLILACVIIEAVVWVLFNHTGLGAQIYSQIKL
jgi:hypothetical protein